MPDDRLTERLRAYEARIPDTDAPDLSTQRARGIAGWPVLVTGAAAATAAIALVVVVVLSALPSDRADLGPSQAPTAAPSAPSESEQPSPSTATPTPSPAAAASPPTVVWTEVDPIQGSVKTALWADDRWIAGGGAENRAAIWESTDGVTWVPTAPIGPDPTFDSSRGPSGYWVSALSEWNDQLIAGGVNRFGYGDGLLGAVWMSSDGSTWEFRELVSSELADAYPRGAVVAPDGQLVIIGSHSLGSQASAYATADGNAWTEHRFDGDQMESVISVAVAPSRFVAVGSVDRGAVGGPSIHAAAWTSTDGRTWNGPPTGEPGYFASVAYDAQGDRFVAGGTTLAGGAELPIPAVWLSPDGVTWSRVEVDTRSGIVQQVAVHEGVILAAGATSSAGEVQLWASRDGRSWTHTALATGGTDVTSVTTHLAAGDGGVILMLETCCETELTRMWTARIEP